MFIKIKPYAQIVEVTEGRKMPLIRQVGQYGLEVNAKGPYGDAASGRVYEFRFQSRKWTVDASDVETRSA